MDRVTMAAPQISTRAMDSFFVSLFSVGMAGTVSISGGPCSFRLVMGCGKNQ
jgi:hypothetical protein